MKKKKVNFNKFVILSEFCNDVAKGLMIAGILGQAVVITDSTFSKIIISAIVIIVSCLFLTFSVLLSNKYDKY